MIVRIDQLVLLGTFPRSSEGCICSDTRPGSMCGGRKGGEQCRVSSCLSCRRGDCVYRLPTVEVFLPAARQFCQVVEQLYSSQLLGRVHRGREQMKGHLEAASSECLFLHLHQALIQLVRGMAVNLHLDPSV
jgi:hypothetical protein